MATDYDGWITSSNEDVHLELGLTLSEEGVDHIREDVVETIKMDEVYETKLSLAVNEVLVLPVVAYNMILLKATAPVTLTQDTQFVETPTLFIAAKFYNQTSTTPITITCGADFPAEVYITLIQKG